MIKWNTLRKQKEEERQRALNDYTRYKTRAIVIERDRWAEQIAKLCGYYKNGTIDIEKFCYGVEGANNFLIEQLNSIDKFHDVYDIDVLKKWA